MTKSTHDIVVKVTGAEAYEVMMLIRACLNQGGMGRNEKTLVKFFYALGEADQIVITEETTND